MESDITFRIKDPYDSWTYLYSYAGNRWAYKNANELPLSFANFLFNGGWNASELRFALEKTSDAEQAMAVLKAALLECYKIELMK